MINPYIFREYDIRGVVDKDLTDEVVENIGKGFSAYIADKGAKTVSVGGDVRLSTNRFLIQLIKGIINSGIDVINIGQVPTPVQYFSMHELNVDGGVMIQEATTRLSLMVLNFPYSILRCLDPKFKKLKRLSKMKNLFQEMGNTRKLKLKINIKNI